MKLLWTVFFSILVVIPVVAQEPARQRILGIDINEAENEDYDTAFIMACQAGMGTLGISLDWVDFEPQPMVYNGTILEIMNIYYPIFDMPVDLTIRPIHTHTLRVPDDLRDVSFDDPRMLERFTDLLDFIFATTPDVRYNSLVIGSEFDSYLGLDAEAWQDYTIFALAVRDYIRETYSTDVPVVYEMIYSSLVGDAADYAQTLNAGADVVGVSYYPFAEGFNVADPTVVSEDFARLVELYPDKPIYFYQFGYPSGEANNSSKEKQADFIREAFRAWDTFAEEIPMIDFTWMSDQSAETVAYFEDYYSFSSDGFASFLGTLGFRERDGTLKLAWTVLQEESLTRGFDTACRF